MDNLQELIECWLVVKGQEKDLSAYRRDLEDQLISRLKLEDLEKNTTKEVVGYKVQASCRVDKKVDVEAAQEIASLHGLHDEMQRLFRWKAEVNSAVWKKSDPELTDLLGAAITTRVSRPSFKIEKIGE